MSTGPFPRHRPAMVFRRPRVARPAGPPPVQPVTIPPVAMTVRLSVALHVTAPLRTILRPTTVIRHSSSAVTLHLPHLESAAAARAAAAEPPGMIRRREIQTRAERRTSRLLRQIRLARTLWRRDVIDRRDSTTHHNATATERHTVEVRSPALPDPPANAPVVVRTPAAVTRAVVPATPKLHKAPPAAVPRPPADRIRTTPEPRARPESRSTSHTTREFRHTVVRHARAGDVPAAARPPRHTDGVRLRTSWLSAADHPRPRALGTPRHHPAVLVLHDAARTPSSSRPEPARTFRRPATRQFRADPVTSAPVPPATPPPAAAAAPVPPPAPALDLDRLGRDLWKRFETRLRVEQERRGRG